MRVIGVDVGTTSVRLALVEFDGPQETRAKVLANRERPLSHKQDGERFEQSSKEIWEAISQCSKECLVQSSGAIDGIAFSATCSLVIESKIGPELDVIMWIDHRAGQEAANLSKQTKLTRQFGGVCSPEFSISKLLWLHNNETDRLDRADGLFELPDWLVYKCIQIPSDECPRSLCCLACKWGYNVQSDCHCESVQALGRKDKRGTRVLKPGQVAGHLSSKAAEQLGLDPSNRVQVATSLIDAHAGMFAILSTEQIDTESTLCSLAGTSSCHMLLSRQERFVPGVWGPYKDVILDGFYLLEAGQTTTGKSIDNCIRSHHKGREMLDRGLSITEIICRIDELYDTRNRDSPLHALPNYHGNRSPLNNPRLRAGFYGISEDTVSSDDSLVDYYIATLESICFELKMIIDHLGIEKLDKIVVSGGLAKNHSLMCIMASILRCKVVTLTLGKVDFMVIGASLLARHAVQSFNSETYFPIKQSNIEGMKYDQLEEEVHLPDPARLNYYDKKFLCYNEFLKLAIAIDAIETELP